MKPESYMKHFRVQSQNPRRADVSNGLRPMEPMILMRVAAQIREPSLRLSADNSLKVNSVIPAAGMIHT
jgi:hypothetical protein